MPILLLLACGDEDPTPGPEAEFYAIGNVLFGGTLEVEDAQVQVTWSLDFEPLAPELTDAFPVASYRLSINDTQVATWTLEPDDEDNAPYVLRWQAAADPAEVEADDHGKVSVEDGFPAPYDCHGEGETAIRLTGTYQFAVDDDGELVWVDEQGVPYEDQEDADPVVEPRDLAEATIPCSGVPSDSGS